MQGKVGDSFSHNCEEFTCEINSDGIPDWTRSAVLSKNCNRNHGGRNHCKKPHVSIKRIFLHDLKM